MNSPEDNTPSDTPSFEDVVRDLGEDKMDFFSEMVRPDKPPEEEYLNSNRTRKVAYGFLSTCRSLLGSGKIGPVQMVSVREICTTFGKTPICGNPASHFKRCERLFWK